jgi:hypothetical protein
MFDVITINSGSGIGSSILFIIKSLIYKKLYNRTSTLYVDTRVSAKVVKTFLHNFIHFDKPGEVEFIEHDVTPKFELFNTHIVVDKLKDFDPQIKLKLAQHFFKRHFTFQSWVQDIINTDPLINQHYDFSIMIRRGCKPHLEPHLKLTELSEYVKYINKKEYNNIFVASDTISVMKDIKILCPNLNISSYLQESDKGFFMWEVANWSDEYTKQHIIKFCKELTILSKTKETMSDINSNVYAITLYMREFEPESIIIDKSLHPTFNWKNNPYFI